MPLSIDASLLRAAAHAERAATMADAAARVELPNWFRRGAAIGQLERQWSAAADEARRGVAELDGLGEHGRDAATAIGQLADCMSPGPGFRVDDARHVELIGEVPSALQQRAAMLRQQAVYERGDPTTVREALQAELDGIVRQPIDAITADQARRVGEIASLPSHLRPPLPKPMNEQYGAAGLAVDGWPHSFADQGRPELEHLRLDLLRRELVGDPSTTKSMLEAEVRDILAASEVSPEQAERLAVLGRLGDELRPAILDAPRPYSARSLDRMLPSDWSGRLQLDALRRAGEVERILGDPNADRTTLTAEFVSSIVRPDAALTEGDLVRLGAIGSLPETLRPPLRIVNGDVAFAPRNGTVSRPDGIGGPGLFPATRLDLVRLDPEGAADAVRARLAGGEAVDDAVVVELGRSANLLERAGIDDATFEGIANRVLVDKRGPDATADVRSLLMDVERRRMAADPSVDRAGLDAELRAIIATPDESITPAQLRRVSLIAGMPDELRPTITDTPVPWSTRRPLRDFAAWEPEPGQPMRGLGVDAHANVDALRLGVELEHVLADPQLTRTRVSDEVVRLLSLPNDELTPADVRRLSLLARLPEHLRPSLPDLGDTQFRLQDLGVLGYHPASDRSARSVFDLVRVHVTASADPDATARRLIERIDAGEAIDFRVVAALAEQPGVLERHGITPAVLSRAAVGGLRASGSSSRAAIEPQLTMIRAGIETMDTTVPGAETVQAQALELIDRNLDRVTGRLTDGLAGHPDYAELGRVMSLADLLQALQPAPKAAPAGAASKVAGETLTW